MAPPATQMENSSFLIIKPSSFGDVIHALPVARAIKLAHPNARVDWVVADSLAGLVALSPHVDSVIPFKRAKWTKWWRPGILAEITGQIASIRTRKYDVVIDLQGLLRSGLMTFVCQGNIKAGFANAREGAWLFYGARVTAPKEAVHAIDRYMSLLPAVGVANGAGVEYDLAEDDSAAAWADQYLPKTPFAVVNPNARWATKQWPLERYGQLCHELVKDFGHQIVIVGGPGEEPNGAKLAALAGVGALDLTGKTNPAQLAALFRRAKVLFTNDSGPLHLAVAVGLPTVSLFGPTDPARTGPYGQGHLALRSGRACSPCFLRACPYHHECMTDLEAPKVAQAWRRAISPDGASNG